MRNFEAILGILAAFAAIATAGLAILVGGNLVAGFFAEDAVAPPQTAMSATESAPAAENAGQVTETATQAASPETTASPTPQPAMASAAVGINVKDGEKVFKKCKACHTATEGGKSGTGPNLWNIIGREVASVEGFAYSDPMRALDGAWTAERLEQYLIKPKDYLPGTKMTFAGLRKETDRQGVILFLAQNAPTPLSAADLGYASGGEAAVEESTTETAEATEAVEIDPVPYPEGVTYTNPPARTADADAAIATRVADLQTLAPTLDYERARYHPLHFPPQISEASNEECLVCHQEILDHKPLEASPAGVSADASIAWYQTLDTYFGTQESFHYRHLESDYAKAVMNLECKFCHKGNDAREESPDMMTGRPTFTAASTPEFTLRKMVNPSETCLLCHGAMPDPEEIMGFEGPWSVARVDMEWPEAPNGCLSCHAESFRTNRHDVTYLNAANIEEIARWGSSDSCYGCHGGRAWYQTTYPYPRHEWPLMEDMVGSDIPEWAAQRPTMSNPAYALPLAAE